MKRNFILLFLLILVTGSACSAPGNTVNEATWAEFYEALDFVTEAVCDDVMSQIVDENLKVATSICQEELSKMMIQMDGWPGEGCSSFHNCSRDDAHHLAFEIVYEVGKYNSNSQDNIIYADGTGTSIHPDNYTGALVVSSIVDGLKKWTTVWDQTGITTPVP